MACPETSKWSGALYYVHIKCASFVDDGLSPSAVISHSPNTHPTHVFAGPVNPGAALLVIISANFRDGALSHK